MADSQPVLCLVTDRRRLARPDEESLLRLIGAAARGGVRLIQLRERDLDDRRLLALARRAVAAVAGTPAALVVNERTDIALAAGAAGVHLRGSSISAVRVRTIVPAGFVIGRSVRGAAEAMAEVSGADYLVMGTIFGTPAKPGVQAAGPGALAQACESVQAPVLAIGGITLANCGAAAAAGAAGIAAIGLFADVWNAWTGDAPDAEFGRIVEAVTRAFAAVPGGRGQAWNPDIVPR